MRNVILIMGLLLFAVLMNQPQSSDRSPASQQERGPTALHTCRIVTGYGTAIGRGSSKLAAKENAREICGTQLIDDYFARRGKIDPDVKDDLVLACVNKECI